jgi:hypothetical protein
MHPKVVKTDEKPKYHRLSQWINMFSYIQTYIHINIAKTKVIIVNKSGRICRQFQFLLHNKYVKIVNNYKYLGIVFTASGSFNKSVLNLKHRALKAYFKVQQYLSKCSQSTISLILKLSNSVVKPILLYGSEVWGSFLRKIPFIELFFYESV